MVLQLEDLNLVFSPGAPLAEQAGRWSGKPMVLVAPSLGHTAGVAPWTRAVEARVVAAEPTAPRLRAAGYAGPIEGPEGFEAPGVEIHAPPGSGIGELWVRLEDEGRVVWLVCDAFSNLSRLGPGRLAKLLQRLYGLKEGLQLGVAFRRRASDGATFLGWLEAQLQRGCDALVPCHGEIDEGPQLAERMLARARSGLG